MDDDGSTLGGGTMGMMLGRDASLRANGYNHDPRRYGGRSREEFAMTDPESTTELRPADLAEVEIDEADAESRDVPLEADDADVAEQRLDLADGGEDPDERDR